MKSHAVEFLLVGGMAVKCYEPCREVDDLDLLLSPEKGNWEKFYKAVMGLGLEISKSIPTKKVQIPFKRYHYADILFDPDTALYKSLSQGALEVSVNAVLVSVPNRSALLAFKQNSKREKDKQDALLLQQV